MTCFMGLVKVRSRVHGFYGLALSPLIHVDGNADRVDHFVLAQLYSSPSSSVVNTPSSLKIGLLVQTFTSPWSLVPLFSFVATPWNPTQTELYLQV